MISPDVSSSAAFPNALVVLTGADKEDSKGCVGMQVPDFASSLLQAVDEAWSNLSILAKCSSHKDFCAIAGARIAKELHKKGATTGADAFESFKSLYERFTPNPNTLLEVPLPSVDNKALGGGNIFSTAPTDAGVSATNSSSFSNKFETVLKKVHWSPAERTTTSRTAGIQPSSRSSDGRDVRGTTCSSAHQSFKRPVASVMSIDTGITRDPKRHKA